MTGAPRHPRRRIAILGAGPIGLEAALYARELGHEPIVYERGDVGENVMRWGFVRLFSPWKMNVSSLGLEAVRRVGVKPPDREAFPTGHELADGYLRPIALFLGASVETKVEVLGVSRMRFLKGDDVGGKVRAALPFRILLRRGSKEEEASADILIDSTGVYATPCALGDGGLPAVGETLLGANIDYHLVNLEGAARGKFAGKTILVVGSGFSAATSLDALQRLQHEETATRVVWARHSGAPEPFPLHANDPLPERERLSREGNLLAANPPHWLRTLSGVSVVALSSDGGRLKVELRRGVREKHPEAVTVDRIIANVGYRPDIGIHRELQVHHCYASEGPMALAAALLDAGAKGDCLKSLALGPETLRCPEPSFFIVGHKSYGRRSDFLLRTGHEQVRDVFRLIEGDSTLDLHAPGTSP